MAYFVQLFIVLAQRCAQDWFFFGEEKSKVIKSASETCWLGICANFAREVAFPRFGRWQTKKRLENIHVYC